MPTRPPRHHVGKPATPQQAKRQAWKRSDARRGSACERGYNAQWRKARAAFLAHHPLCVACKAEGVIKDARVVDHIVPHRGDDELFEDRGNWQGLCDHCHNRKTGMCE